MYQDFKGRTFDGHWQYARITLNEAIANMPPIQDRGLQGLVLKTVILGVKTIGYLPLLALHAYCARGELTRVDLEDPNASHAESLRARDGEDNGWGPH